MFSLKKSYDQANSPRVVKVILFFYKPAANIQIIRNYEESKIKSTLENTLLESKANGILFSVKFEKYFFM